MYLKNIFVYYFIVLFLASCQKERKLSYISIQNDTVPKLEFTEKERKTWYLKDIIEDSIPGVSLEKANSDILFIKTQKRTIVALIDTEISIDHDKLKNNFWINKKEIPDNNIDDDNNGYIDDINGWNFIGNSREENLFYALSESTRIVVFFNSLISKSKNNDTLSVIPHSSLNPLVLC